MDCSFTQIVQQPSAPAAGSPSPLLSFPPAGHPAASCSRGAVRSETSPTEHVYKRQASGSHSSGPRTKVYSSTLGGGFEPSVSDARLAATAAPIVERYHGRGRQKPWPVDSLHLVTEQSLARDTSFCRST